jgi:CubicO group peptidase (beta-lactamase class C family)
MTVEVDAEPKDLSFAPDRLLAIDRHFRRYVDEGLLPGWQILVTRNGRIAYSSVYGRYGLKAGSPVRPDTLSGASTR